MKTLFFSTQEFERPFLQEEAKNLGIELIEPEFKFLTQSLNKESVLDAGGFEAVSLSTVDDASAPVLIELSQLGVNRICLRSAGYDQVDLKKAAELSFSVTNIPDYSPHAIAEHTLALILFLARNLREADKEVHKLDFRTKNLIGFEIHNRTVGIIGLGKIGGIVARILHGFGAKILAYDINRNPALVVESHLQYVDLKELVSKSDIISLHTGLNPQTHHLIDNELIRLMKPGVMLINSGRGACIDTESVLEALEKGIIGYFGADVYEFEKGIFFQDHSKSGMKDHLLTSLLKMPNVIITPHQAFATEEALKNIAMATLKCIQSWDKNETPEHELIEKKSEFKNRVENTIF
jgi:D-lactate dehydrogenase